MAAIDPITAITNVFGSIIDRVFPDPKEAAEAKQQLLDAQASVIEGEEKGESWLQRNWRPITMLCFVVIIANNFIIYPYLRLFWHDAPTMQIPTDMWDLLKIGIGGYIGGRSFEKVATQWASTKK